MVPIYHASSFEVISGANLGDSLSFAEELILDDVYELSETARQSALSFIPTNGNHFEISDESAVGRPGATICLDSCVTLMPPTGETIEALVLVEVDNDGNVAEIYLQPLSPLMAKTPYSLVGVDRDAARRRLAQMACVSFSKGTRITTMSGKQVPIEKLRAGDIILTRDVGGQPIRWIGKVTMRAVGEFAPVVITAQTLNNANDLVVSPQHRLFIYQRSDRIGAGRNELLIKARHLVNGDTVHIQEGGFIEYYQLLFDDHQIIFAEGISAETMMADRRTTPVLPEELRLKLSQPQIGAQKQDKSIFEVSETLLRRPDAAEILRRASSK